MAASDASKVGLVSDSGGQETKKLPRIFSPFAMLGLAFAVLNPWVALSASLPLALPNGGPSAVIWGLVTSGVCHMCLALSLAEFLSAYPDAGGQYHWVAAIAPKNGKPLLSWTTGWVSTFGWTALAASGGLLGSHLITGVIALEHPDFVAQRWQQFLIYMAYNICGFLINTFLNSRLRHMGKLALIWSIAGFAIICITILACASPNFNSGHDVFRNLINLSGWPDGVAWILGLLQGSLGLTGFDAVAHMIEEIPNPTIEGPKIMINCIVLGTFAGFVFLTCLLFVAGDLEQVTESNAGPLLEILFNATKSRAGAICLLLFPLLCLFFAATSIMTTSSRMIWSFARDGGLPASKYLAIIHPTLEVPLNALILVLLAVLCFGCIFLGSSSAMSAIISAAVVALGLSYALPIGILMAQGRRSLPKDRAFAMWEPLGWIANVISMVFVSVTTVFFLFPPERPVTSSNMNYSIVAIGIVFIISVVQWFVDGRKNYTGPQMLVGAHG